MPDHLGFLKTERRHQRMDADSRRFHIQPVRRYGRIAYPRQIRSDDGESLREGRHQGPPHQRGLRVAVQQEKGRTVTGCQVVQLDALDIGSRGQRSVRRPRRLPRWRRKANAPMQPSAGAMRIRLAGLIVIFQTVQSRIRESQAARYTMQMKRMARSKEFDEERALASAMDVFWRPGYENTSLEALMREMGIARQSLYDTFGDKRALYLKAMAFYREANELVPARVAGVRAHRKGGLHPSSAGAGRGVAGAACARLPAAQREHGARRG